jgi:membrane protease YdiL (CAAX protease family)
MRAGRTAGWIGLIGVLAAIAYGGRLTSGKPPADALYRYDTAVGGVLFYALMVAVVLWLARGLTRRELGLRSPRSWSRTLGLAFATLVVLLIAELALEALLHATREQGLEPPRWEPDRAAPFALNAAVVVLVAPAVEELTFRGAGFALLAPAGSLVALAATSVAFAAAHGLVEGFPALLLFGVAVGFLRLRTGSVYPGMLLHACFNALALASAFAR